MKAMARAYVGTSGWVYAGWKHDFYAGVPQQRWLEHCAERFTGLEINGSFYMLQKATALRDWRRRTPADFRFTMKGHRFVTHNKKLADADQHLPISRDNARPLGPKLAAVVWQLPARSVKNHPRLVEFVTALRRRWRRTRHAIEFRHATWFDDQTAALLREHGIAVCMSDAPDFPLWDEVTTDLVYVRLHGHTRKYASAYSKRQLETWAARTRGWLAEGREVHVYFDNDAEGHAPRDAMRLLSLLRE